MNLLLCEFHALCVCAPGRDLSLLMSIRLFVILYMIVSLCACLRVLSRYMFI